MDTAAIRDRRFAINTYGVATLLPEPGAIAYGALWSITLPDERALDLYEGVAAGFYLKHRIEVIPTRSQQPRRVLAYVARDSHRGMPRTGYLESILSNGRSLGFDEKYLADVATWLPTYSTGRTSPATATGLRPPSQATLSTGSDSSGAEEVR